MVEMSNGCICCTLREDLMIEVTRLAREGRFDALLIESTGVSEPMPVAETFTFEDENGFSLSSLAQIDCMVTLVDAPNFLRDYCSQELLTDRSLAIGEEDERTIVDLLADQIEFANLIGINKTDCVTPDELATVRGMIHSLNPRARVHLGHPEPPQNHRTTSQQDSGNPSHPMSLDMVGPYKSHPPSLLPPARR
jgi:G3E family GTPase